MPDVYCAFTGSIPDEADLPLDHPLEDEDLSDLPVGWTRISVQTREANPEWEMILAVEESMVKQIVEGLPKAQRKAAIPAIRVQVAAQFAALKAQTVPYLIQTATFHVSPGAADTEQSVGMAKLRELLGVSDEDRTEADLDGADGGDGEQSDESAV